MCNYVRTYAEIDYRPIKNIQELHSVVTGKPCKKVLPFGEILTIRRLQFGGSELSLFQCRLKNPLPARVALKLKAPAVDSIDTTLETVIAEFLENFDMTCKDAEEQDHILDDFSSSEVQEICLQAIRDEITKLLRLNEDMIRVLGNKKEHQKFHLTEDSVTK